MPTRFGNSADRVSSASWSRAQGIYSVQTLPRATMRIVRPPIRSTYRRSDQSAVRQVRPICGPPTRRVSDGLPDRPDERRPPDRPAGRPGAPPTDPAAVCRYAAGRPRTDSPDDRPSAAQESCRHSDRRGQRDGRPPDPQNWRLSSRKIGSRRVALRRLRPVSSNPRQYSPFRCEKAIPGTKSDENRRNMESVTRRS